MRILRIILIALVMAMYATPIYAQHEPVEIIFDSAGMNDLELKQKSDVYEIHTTGQAPYLYTAPLEAPLPKGVNILGFDYYSIFHLNGFRIFFNTGKGESKYSSDDLGVREGWSQHSILLADEIGDWGKKGDFLRIQFGNAANYTIQVKNIRLRMPTPEEVAKVMRKEETKRKDSVARKKLENYFSAGYSYGIERVSVLKNKVVITGTAPVQNGVYLAEFPLHANAFDVTHSRKSIKLHNKQFTVSVNRFESNKTGMSDRLLSRWAIVEEKEGKYRLLSPVRYADTVEPVYNLPKVLPATKKGLGDFSANRPLMVSDLDSLRITSVTVNIWLLKMLRSQPSDETTAFTYNGNTYYVNREWLTHLDSTMLEAAKRKIHVSAIVLIDRKDNCPDKTIGAIFEHPDYDPSGVYTMPNMNDSVCVEYYAAAIDFLARRYSREDKKYGRIHCWIAHNEVDAGWVWTNMGEKHQLLYMDAYHKSMRLINYIAKKYDRHAKVFISLTHHWNWTSDKRFYHSRDLLDILLEYSKLEGDFDWAIAHHPFPESLFEPKSWLDKKCDYTFNTPLITFKNIEVLNEWIKQPRTMFRGKFKRTVFLSEQGPNSRDYSEKSLLEQAASMAYVWKKIKNLDGIIVFQYQSWRDYREEGGMLLGMRRFPDDETDPFGKKPVWYVYRDIGTPREDEACEFAKEIIGIKSWDEVRAVIGN